MNSGDFACHFAALIESHKEDSNGNHPFIRRPEMVWCSRSKTSKRARRFGVEDDDALCATVGVAAGIGCDPCHKIGSNWKRYLSLRRRSWWAAGTQYDFGQIICDAHDAAIVADHGIAQLCNYRAASKIG